MGRSKLWFRGVSLPLWDASHHVSLIFCGLPRKPSCVASRESAPSQIVSCSHLLGAVCELITRKVNPCAFFNRFASGHSDPVQCLDVGCVVVETASFVRPAPLRARASVAWRPKSRR